MTINEYDIEREVKARSEVQYILKAIEGLKAQITSDNDFFTMSVETQHKDFALSLQCTALEQYVDTQIRDAIAAARNENESVQDDESPLFVNPVDDSNADNLEETSRFGAN